MGRLRQILQNRRAEHCQPQRPAPAKSEQGGLAARCAGEAAAPPAQRADATAPAQQAAEQRPAETRQPETLAQGPQPQPQPQSAPAEPPAQKGDAREGEAQRSLFGWNLGGLTDRVGQMIDARRPQVKPEEKEAIDRMIGLMPELAGQDGRFNRGDLEPIRESLQPEVRGVVNGEINRRAQERVDQARPLLRPLVRAGARAHLRQRGDEYRAMGMQQGNQQIRSGLGEAFDRMGDQTTARDGDGQRRLTLDDLKRFGQDAQALEAISRRAQEKGLPKFEFPRGMSAEDLAAIREGRLPPNGVPVFRQK